MNYKQIYDHLFATYGYNNHTHREHRFLLTIEQLKKFNLESLIDIGTGSGDILEIIQKFNPSAKLTAVDLNNYHNLNNINHISADITKLEDRDKVTGHYDALTCLDCLEHFEEKHIDDILKMFTGLSDLFLLSIANHSDVIDGTELHLIQKDSTWWTNKLSKYFEINYFESFYDGTLYFYKCKKRKTTMKYSILMPYYKRSLQLHSTLKSFSHFYKDREDFEIILIVDNKNTSQDLEQLDAVLELFKDLNINKINGTNEDSYSPAANYNIGAMTAIGKFLILTNPEAMHTIDILSGLDTEFDKSINSYIVCSCMSVGVKYIPIERLGNVAGKWYQHSNYRNTGCHFCSVISIDNYWKVGGFSNEFSPGIGFDDDDFRNKVQSTNIPFVYRDDLIALHLNHDKDAMDKEKYLKNKALYNVKWGENSFRAELLPVV